MSDSPFQITRAKAVEFSAKLFREKAEEMAENMTQACEAGLSLHCILEFTAMRVETKSGEPRMEKNYIVYCTQEAAMAIASKEVRDIAEPMVRKMLGKHKDHEG